MFRHLLPFRRLLATSFLLVFVNVLAGQCWCATMKSMPVAQARAVAVAPAKPAHPGCPGHGAAPAAKQTKPQQQQPTKSNDCCQDKSASLLSSLTTPVEKQLFVAASALLPAAADFHFRPAAGRWNRMGAVVLVPQQHLPPKIPDIRIYIQSLTV